MRTTDVLGLQGLSPETLADAMMTESVSSCNSLVDILWLAFCSLLVYCKQILMSNADYNFLAVNNNNALHCYSLAL